MKARPASVARLAVLVRRNFQLLSSLWNDELEDLGVTASHRALMEHIAQTGPQSVPRIAEAKSVRRQSIQALVDGLEAAGLVRLEQNPAHRRSRLVALSKRGAGLFERIRERDKVLVSRIATHLEEGGVACAVDALDALRRALELEKGEENVA